VACQKLVRLHAAKKDKIIIFSDNLLVLRVYAKILECDSISGKTPSHERVEIFRKFENSPDHNVLVISKVGDNSIDLPGANVII
jgi:DNA excision repair protein ERCC-3